MGLDEGIISQSRTGKNLGGNVSLIKVLAKYLSRGDLGNPGKLSVTVACVQDKIRNEHLQNINLERYLFSSTIGPGTYHSIWALSLTGVLFDSAICDVHL
jgi:hypothetical protein